MAHINIIMKYRLKKEVVKKRGNLYLASLMNQETWRVYHPEHLAMNLIIQYYFMIKPRVLF